MGLDVKTIVIFNALAALSASIGLFITSRKLDEGSRHGLLWAYGSLAQGLAYVLLGLRDSISLELSIIVGNGLLFAAPVLYFLELHIFYDQPYTKKIPALLAALAALIVGTYYFSAIVDDINARVVISSMWIGSALISLTVMIAKNYPVFPLRSSIISGFAFLLTGIIMFVRAAITASGYLTITNLFSQNVLQDITFLNSFLLVLITTFGYVLMLNERIQKDLHRLATLDSLTEVYNRRMIMRIVREEFERTRRESTPSTLILLDLDNFKLVNDSFGHLAGDALLRRMAAMVSAEMREYDSLGRYGGDEFLIVAANTSEEDGRRIAKRIIEKIDQTPVPWKGEEVCLEASAGIGTFKLDDADFLEALHRADQSLYEAKDEH